MCDAKECHANMNWYSAMRKKADTNNNMVIEKKECDALKDNEKGACNFMLDVCGHDGRMHECEFHFCV